MSMIIRQSTSIDVPIGPFLDSVDGNSQETALTITQPDVRLKKNGGNWAQKAAAQTLSHEEAGWYEVTLDATDTDTVGHLIVAVHESGALAAWREFQVVEEVVYDALFASGATGALPVSSGGIAAAAFAAGAIDASAIAANAIGSSELADGAITSAKFAAGAITATVIATDAIDDDAIATGAIASSAFAAGAINAAAVAADAIGASELAADAASEIATAVWAAATRTLTALGFTLGAGDLAADTITAAKIAPDAIGASELAADAATEIATAVWASVTRTLTALGFTLGASDLAADTITATKIATDAITAAKIAADAIGASELATDAVTEIVNAVWAAAARTLTALDEDSTTLDLDATIRAAIGLASANLDTQLDALPTNAELATALAAADDAVLAAIAALSIPTANQNADALLDRANAIETGYTLRGVMRLLSAVLLGKIDDAATTTNTFRSITDAKDRVTSTVDADGNRTMVTLDAT